MKKRIFVCLLALAVSCGPSPETEPEGLSLAGQDCLLIVLDALHADHLGCYGEPRPTSPHIDALAAGGVRFTAAWSQTSWTLASTASLMTSLYQESHGVQLKDQSLGEEAFTMAEAFRAAGYETFMLTENPFCSKKFGLDQGFDTVRAMYGEPKSWWSYGEGEAGPAEQIIELLGDRQSRPPRFVYAHLRRPHAPYNPPSEVQDRFVDPAYDGPVRGLPKDIARHAKGDYRMKPDDVAHMRNLYQAGLSVADAEIGKLLAGIDTDHTLVVVMSDHGDAFAQHKTMGHNFSSYQELVHIPLIMAYPDLPGGRVVDTPVMSIDMLPTLGELFGLDLPRDRLQGRSLLPELLDQPGPARPAVFTSSRVRTGQMFAATDGRMKYIRVPDRKQEMLFDLVADPREQHDLAAKRPGDVSRLRSLVDAWLAGQIQAEEPGEAELDKDTEAALRGLGYLGGKDR